MFLRTAKRRDILMRSLITRRAIAFALIVFFAAGLYFAQRLVCGMSLQRRDRWQKPDEILKAMDLKPGMVVVDIGAGDGYFTRRFALVVGPDGKAIGVEIDSSKVREMTEDAKERGLSNYEARLVKADDPQLAPRSADVIFLCNTYHHIEGRVPYFARVKSALKPGGRLLILDFKKTRAGTREEPRYTKEEVTEELTEAGYKLVKEFDVELSRQYFLEFAPANEGSKH